MTTKRYERLLPIFIKLFVNETLHIYPFFYSLLICIKHTVDLRHRETRVAPFTEIAPHGKIPVIVDPNGPSGRPVTIFESGACLLYLADKHKELIPCGDPHLRIETISWLFWGSSKQNN